MGIEWIKKNLNGLFIAYQLLILPIYFFRIYALKLNSPHLFYLRTLKVRVYDFKSKDFRKYCYRNSIKKGRFLFCQRTRYRLYQITCNCPAPRPITYFLFFNRCYLSFFRFPQKADFGRIGNAMRYGHS